MRIPALLWFTSIDPRGSFAAKQQTWAEGHNKVELSVIYNTIKYLHALKHMHISIQT